MKGIPYMRIARKILLIFLILQMLVFNIFASDNVLSLYKNKPSDNTPFSVANMFPGDYIKQDYCVRVSYNGTITVHFTARIRPGDENKKLAEVLKTRVLMPDESVPGKRVTLYEGLLRDIGDITHTISGVNTTEDLNYEIEVFLDTSVGNEYQDLALIADFEWWAETSDDEGGDGPGGGDGPVGPSKPPFNPDNPSIDPDNPPIDPDNPPIDPDNPPIDPDNPPIDPDNPPIDPDNPPGEQKPTGELIDPPNTGDSVSPVLLIVLICVALLILFLILFVKKKNENEKNPTIKKLTICIAIIIVLALCLTITTYALIRSTVMVDENVFRTGTVKIDLNGGEPIISEKDRILFEPGMTVCKDFFIRNEGSDSVYYKIYLDNVKGGLAKVLEIKILDKNTGSLLYEGSVGNLTQENSLRDDRPLVEERTLTAIFHYPENAGNSTKNMTLEFDMCAVATQTRNNPNREFD